MEKPTFEPGSKETNIAAGVFMGVIVIAIIGFIVYIMNQPPVFTGNGNTGTQNQQPKDEVKDLDISVKRTVYGLEITNNESKEMVNCKVAVNPSDDGGYISTETFAPTVPKTIPWSMLLKKDGERFDFSERDVTTVLVNMCDGQDARYASFGLN